MVKFSDLVSYFEYLAKNHKSIGDTDDERHFFRYELEEVLTSLGNNVNFPAMILEGYDFDYTDAASDNVIKNRNGAFMIIDREGDENNWDRIHELFDSCEEIGDEVVMRILSDKRNRNVPVVRNFEIWAVQGNMIANRAEGYYGIRYTFSLQSPRNNETDATKWTDGGEYSEV
jgi:hypothetical protein